MKIVFNDTQKGTRENEVIHLKTMCIIWSVTAI